MCKDEKNQDAAQVAAMCREKAQKIPGAPHSPSSMIICYMVPWKCRRAQGSTLILQTLTDAGRDLDWNVFTK